MSRLFKNLSFILILLAIWSCEEEIVPPDLAPAFSIEAVSVPVRLNTAGGKMQMIAFKVTHPEGVEAIASVNAVFSNTSQAELLTLPLLDDGGNNASGSMDAIARDGVFTNLLIPDANVFPNGGVVIRVDVVDVNSVSYQSDTLQSTAFPNSLPRLITFSATDTIRAGNQPVLFSAVAQDDDSLKDISAVEMTLFDGEFAVKLVEFPRIDSLGFDRGNFGVFLDSSFAAALQGDYELQIKAEDLAGENSSTISRNIHMINLPPVISAPSIRDTIPLPAPGSPDTLHVKLTVRDSQGGNDLSQVAFTVTLLGGNASDPIPMFDDGNQGGADHGDDVRGDGRFSEVIQLLSTNQPGTYVFQFTATDRVGHTSNVLTDTLIVTP